MSEALQTLTPEAREYHGFLGSYRSEYIQREIVGENAEGKAEHRAAVLDFVLNNHSGKMKLFSLPSVGWIFEQELLAAYPGAQFVAVEREYQIYRASRMWMPGGHRADCIFPLVNGELEYSETACARLIYGGASMLTGLGRNDFPSGKKHKLFLTLFKGWSCIWLDFTSQICFEVEKILPRLGAFCTTNMARDVPVAITVMKARERRDVNNKLFVLNTDRAGYLSALLSASRFRDFKYSHTFEHISASTPMLTVFGTLTAKAGGAQ